MTIPVFSAGDFRKVKELRLVLTAAGIPNQTVQRHGGWQLLVRPDDSDSAIAELQDYQAENTSRTVDVARRAEAPGAAWAALFYCFVVGSISVLAAPWGYGVRLADLGTSIAGNVTAGEWYRCFTALTLHLDMGHLASNLLFGSFFGFLLGRTYGGGLTWLLIVLSGFLGNLANAYFQAPEHQSIGASTAVFGAIGLMMMDAFRSYSRQESFRKWTPILGGIMLLSMLGVGGERTDVMAHVFGLIAGVIIGAAATTIPDSVRMNTKVQWLIGIAALGLISTAWCIA
ncbi:rhomboid family intramembrane serine protease [Stieleria sp. JC731]|uniref:rhomboid family intramembrane serine protease n=1 Tax=Pirellulaceae TaxID=2691357 RepID=UPI001E54B296|nr:rhomboid family intramembrane serine protease [Stieleria sp. JC731]MCC9603164.1 rhomboid family intramembrane serine protease [Stieleria sp. JC731]